MKKSIQLSALFLLFSTGLFAATPVDGPNRIDINQVVSVNALRSSAIGVSVSVSGALSNKSFMTITDMAGNKLYSDNLSTKPGLVKGYNLSELEDGDYIITIFANKQELKKQIHIYEEYGKKTYFIMQ